MEGSHPFYKFSKILLLLPFFFDPRGQMKEFGLKNILWAKAGYL